MRPDAGRRGKGEVLLVEVFDRGARRARAEEGAEEELHGALHLRVGVQHHAAELIVDEPHRQPNAQLATAGLGEQATSHAGRSRTDCTTGSRTWSEALTYCPELGGAVGLAPGPRRLGQGEEPFAPITSRVTASTTNPAMIA